MDVCLVTSNMHKLKEAEYVLGVKLKYINYELDELQSLSVERVVKHKAISAYLRFKRPLLVEDTGLFIYSLGGFPGALIKCLVQSAGTEKICRIVDSCDSRGAYAKTAVAFSNGKKTNVFVGRIEGSIALHPKGGNGFGWDSIFIPKGSMHTFAEMSLQEKSRISMRRKAFAKFSKFMKNNI